MNRLTLTSSRFPTSYSSPLNLRLVNASKLHIFWYGAIGKIKPSFSRQTFLIKLFENARRSKRLELLLAHRTRDLLETQIQRNMELERFAEFGRICANIMHEVASPLTAASINLDMFDGSETKNIARARKNLQQIERYLDATRSQLKSQSHIENFSIKSEFNKLILFMEPLASKANIRIIFETSSNYRIQGDPVKFSQVLANLISNAIDAYEGVTIDNGQKTIVVSVDNLAKYLRLSVIDYGKGIEPNALPWIFKPFYTTKSDSERGTGIGLTMVKRVIEEDFRGAIKVISNPRIGTRFIINFNH